MRKRKTKSDSILIGVAGEYFVAGELSRRGYIASITLRNTASIDILASNGERTVNIQVKTRCIEKSDNWNFGGSPLKYKEIINKIFYVLVEIHSDINNKEIGYYIISENELNKLVEENFLDWKSKNKRNGEPRKSDVRIFRIKEYPMLNIGKYKDNWDILFN